MDQRRNDYLGEAQHRDEILAMIEFDYLFPRFDILREGATILHLQGFWVVRIIGFKGENTIRWNVWIVTIIIFLDYRWT
jgi:hypothetical protein